MHPTEKCLELVKKFEGFSPKIYVCPAGYPTIGYGHVVTPEEREKFKNGITEEEAEELLRQDLLKFAKAIKPLIKVPIHPYMFDALLSFTFNVGVYAFKASTLRRKVNAKEWQEAADQFLRWVYAGGRKLPGLVRRRQEERKLFLLGYTEVKDIR
ncbi:MAG: lysozyme [Thermodesulfobacterium sp.]|nr:lysozyme [Thermodesulfobacterium sp.]